MIAFVQEEVRELRRRRQALDTLLTESKKSANEWDADVESSIAAAMNRFKQLSEAAKNADPKLVRQFLSEAVERIEVFCRKERWGRKRFKYHLERGLITLKSSSLSCTVR